jgi:hypothetical protein
MIFVPISSRRCLWARRSSVTGRQSWGRFDGVNLGGVASSMSGMLSPKTHIVRRVWRAGLPTCSPRCRSGYFYSTSLGDAAARGLLESGFPYSCFSSPRFLGVLTPTRPISSGRSFFPL